MLDEHEIERCFERLAGVEPSEGAARIALERAEKTIENQASLKHESKRRIIMLARIAAVILVLAVVSSAVGGAIWYVASNDGHRQPETNQPDGQQPDSNSNDQDGGDDAKKEVESEVPKSDAHRPKTTPPKEPSKPKPQDPPAIVKPQSKPDSPDNPGEKVVAAADQPKIDMEWATVSGTIVFDGDIPKRSPIVVNKDVGYCGGKGLLDESLIVNPHNRGIQNAIVYLYLKSSDPAPKIHPAYDEFLKRHVFVDNANCRFEPHVGLLRTNQTLMIKNADTVAHNAKIDMFLNPSLNPLIQIGKTSEHRFAKRERLPCRVSCNIHPWMGGWVVLMDHPYMAVTDENGYFEIRNLPPGEWTFQFWHESQGYIQDVNRNGIDENWKRGRVTQELSAGTFDFGKIKTTIDRDN